MDYVFCAVRAYHAIVNYIEQFIPFGTTYRSTWKICNVETNESYSGDTREEFCFTDAFPLLIHTVHRIKGIHEEVRCAVHWTENHRDAYFVDQLFDKPIPPWLFIGYREKDETIIDCTEILDKFVCAGNFIHRDLLDFVVPEACDKPWVYIQPETFEETDFPSDGILIKDKYEENESASESPDKKTN